MTPHQLDWISERQQRILSAQADLARMVETERASRRCQNYVRNRAAQIKRRAP
jgi:hypothetical protein